MIVLIHLPLLESVTWMPETDAEEPNTVMFVMPRGMKWGLPLLNNKQQGPYSHLILKTTLSKLCIPVNWLSKITWSPPNIWSNTWKHLCGIPTTHPHNPMHHCDKQEVWGWPFDQQLWRATVDLHHRDVQGTCLLLLQRIFPVWWPCHYQMILKVYLQPQILCSACNTGPHKESSYHELSPTAASQPHNEGVCLNPACFKKTIQLGCHLTAMLLHWSDLYPHKSKVDNSLVLKWFKSTPYHSIQLLISCSSSRVK